MMPDDSKVCSTGVSLPGGVELEEAKSLASSTVLEVILMGGFTR